MVQRPKVRAYTVRAGGVTDTLKADAVGRIIHKAYSGYVHAASPQIMDMVGGNPPRFYISGTDRRDRRGEQVMDARNYFCRGLMSAAMVAVAFKDADLVKDLYAALHEFEVSTDRTS